MRGQPVRSFSRSGRATSRLTPQQILTLIESLAVGWTITTAEFLTGTDAPSRDRQAAREIIIDSLRRLLA